jgi:hypothetical protein
MTNESEIITVEAQCSGSSIVQWSPNVQRNVWTLQRALQNHMSDVKKDNDKNHMTSTILENARQGRHKELTLKISGDHLRSNVNLSVGSNVNPYAELQQWHVQVHERNSALPAIHNLPIMEEEAFSLHLTAHTAVVTLDQHLHMHIEQWVMLHEVVRSADLITRETTRVMMASTAVSLSNVVVPPTLEMRQVQVVHAVHDTNDETKLKLDITSSVLVGHWNRSNHRECLDICNHVVARMQVLRQTILMERPPSSSRAMKTRLKSDKSEAARLLEMTLRVDSMDVSIHGFEPHHTCRIKSRAFEWSRSPLSSTETLSLENLQFITTSASPPHTSISLLEMSRLQFRRQRDGTNVHDDDNSTQSPIPPPPPHDHIEMSVHECNVHIDHQIKYMWFLSQWQELFHVLSHSFQQNTIQVDASPDSACVQGTFDEYMYIYNI